MAPDEPIELRRPVRFVGRGGEKLAAALDHFGLPVEGRRALDAGASTGGFTDALLQAGATSVVAVDVGTHQLHERLRRDPRVVVREQTDIRSVSPENVDGPVDLVVADLSFISVRLVVDALVRLLASGGDLVVLVKQVPVVSALEFDAETRTLKREGVRTEVSAFGIRARKDVIARPAVCDSACGAAKPRSSA